MRKAIKWSFLGQYSSTVISLIATMILARLLAPAEIGVFAIAAGFLNIAHTLRDFGITQYLIRETDLSNEKKSGALSIVWVSCMGFCSLLCLGAYPLSVFYSSENLFPVLIILAIDILVVPLGTLPRASLIKAMQFDKLALVSVSSGLANLTVAVVMAVMGFGPVALAFGALLGDLIAIMVLRALMPNVEMFSLDLRNAKVVFREVSQIGMANIVNRLTYDSQPIVIGKTISEAAVAIYDKAFALVRILDLVVFNAIRSLVLPLFSKWREDQEKGVKGYLQVSEISIAVAWPSCLVISINSEILIDLMFGQQWVESVPLVQWVCISFAIASFFRYSDQYLIARSLESFVLRLNVIMLMVRLMFLLWFSRYGLEAFVKAMILVPIIRSLIVMPLLVKHGGICFRQMAYVFLKGVVVLVAAAMPVLLYRVFGLHVQDVFDAAAQGVIMLLCWCVAVYLTKNPLRYFVSSSG